MGPRELKAVLTKALPIGLPIMIKGAPGVGKTDIVTQAARELKMDLIVSHPVVSDPCDYKGLPGIVNGKAEFLPFGDLRALVEAKKPTIAFLDDLGQAPAVVQAAAMQLILARRVNGHKVSDKVVFAAATNRREDRAGVTGILEPVKSRFATILELVPDAEEWHDWAILNNVAPEVISFIKFRPALLTDNKPTQEIVNRPCPRTIAYAGKLIKVGLTDVEVLAGAVGQGCAIELVAHIKIHMNLPTVASILKDPNKAIVPPDTEPAAQWAIVAALVETINEKNAEQIILYSNRLPMDFSVLLIKDAIRKCPNIKKTSAFIKWVGKYGKALMGEN